MPKVSVIIPCYNQGATLEQTVQSVLAQHFVDYEIIIVNDGSTDAYTLEIFPHYEQHEKIFVLHTKNQGLSSARNNGIACANGEFILPLDADDTIAPYYLSEAVAILENEPHVGIVYGQAEFIGDFQGTWNLPLASLQRQLTRNVIFHAAFFRKNAWKCVGGYKTNMRYGLEDWEFWLSLLETGCEIRRIENVVYYYYISSSSMTISLRSNLWRTLYSYFRLMENHKYLYIKNPLSACKLLAIIGRNTVYHLLGKKLAR